MTPYIHPVPSFCDETRLKLLGLEFCLWRAELIDCRA